MTTASQLPSWFRRAGLTIAVALFASSFVLLMLNGSSYVSTSGLPLLYIERDGARVDVDDELSRTMSGAIDIGDDTVLAAYCHNGVDWNRDRSLDLELIVATDPSLVRAAELYADAIADNDAELAGTIAGAESRYWSLGDEDALGEWAEALDDAQNGPEIREYLARRAEPPSPDAIDRFVVYAVSRSVRSQFVVYLDTARMSADFIESPARRFLSDDHPIIAGREDGPSVNLSECDDLAHRWDRFDVRVASHSLPPLEDRWIDRD